MSCCTISRTFGQAGSLTIHSRPDSLRIYLDTLFLGMTPLNEVPVAAGTHTLALFHVADKRWSAFAYAETLVIREGEHVTRELSLPTIYHLVTDPYGASVFLDDSLLGLTPLYLFAGPEAKMFKVTKAGFEEQLVPVGGDATEVRVALKPLPGAPPTRSSLFLSSDESNNPLPIYLSTGAAVVSGVAAAYWKTRADSYYADYRQSGDPSTLDHVRHFDLLSGIALVTSEISFLLLTYQLISR